VLRSELLKSFELESDAVAVPTQAFAIPRLVARTPYTPLERLCVLNELCSVWLFPDVAFEWRFYGASSTSGNRAA
jgi:hypothetical protein